MKKIKIDEDVCIGCGACVSACPECFELNKEGKSIVVSQESNCDVEEIALDCPVQAITVIEED